MSMLELVLAERAAQAEEDARPAFLRVDDLRAFITTPNPPPYLNVSLEMCVLSIHEQDSHWKMELIDKSSIADFQALSAAFEDLASHRRSQFVFQLALWKNRNPLSNNLQCREGFVYHFDRVHSLNLRYGWPCGSVQLREGFVARLIPHITQRSDDEDEQEETSDSQLPNHVSSTPSGTPTPTSKRADAQTEVVEDNVDSSRQTKRTLSDSQEIQQPLASPAKRPRARTQKNKRTSQTMRAPSRWRGKSNERATLDYATADTLPAVFSDEELDDMDRNRPFSIPSVEDIERIEEAAQCKMSHATEELLPCCICELEYDRDFVSVIKPTRALLDQLHRRILVREDMNIPDYVRKQYDASHIHPDLEGLLLYPPAIPHYESIYQLQICKTCKTQLVRDKTSLPPTLSIANGNFVGWMPDNLQLSRTDEQAVALVSPCMSISTVTGGPCRTIKSHHYVVRNTEGPIVAKLPDSLKTRVRITMVGPMTSAQAASCRKRYAVDLTRSHQALAFFYANNRDYKAYLAARREVDELHGLDIGDTSDVVEDNTMIVDETSTSNDFTDRIRDDSSYSRGGLANDREGDATLECLWEDRSSVILPQEPGKPDGAVDILVHKSNSFVSLRSWAVSTSMFPVLFPGGCGGPTEPRKRHLSIQKWIRRCLRIHGHRFERHYGFLLLAFDYLATKNARETLFVKMHVSSAALKASQISPSTLHEAMKYHDHIVVARAKGVKPKPPPPDVQNVIDLRRGLYVPQSAFYGSNQSRMRARHDLFGMLKRFGPIQLFFTVSPDSSGNTQ